MLGIDLQTIWMQTDFQTDSQADSSDSENSEKFSLVEL